MATVVSQVSQLRTRIHSDPNEKVFSDETLLKYLNEAQDILESEVLLPAAKTSSTISLVADQQEYSLASNFIKMVLVRYTANDWILKPITLLSAQHRFTSTSGTPQEYYMWGGNIGFTPVPSANETDAVQYWYVKRLDELVESGAGSGQVTTSEVPEQFHWVLERGAEMLAFQEIGKGDRARTAEIKFTDGISQMRAVYGTENLDYDSTLMTEEQVAGGRNFLFDPYQ